MVLYYAPLEVVIQNVNFTLEQQALENDRWMLWFKKCGDRLIDMGNPLLPGHQITPDGHMKDSDKNVMGYSVLGAENIEEVKDLVKVNPHIGRNPLCTIEIYEFLPVPGM